MSHEIFHRFLRYITLTLRYWRINRKGLIDAATVKEAVTVGRLAEDMEFELAELFPKHGDLRFQAVQVLMHLGEHGPKTQSELGEALGIEAYSISRLLTKLEHNRYLTRTREGTDKIVSLRQMT